MSRSIIMISGEVFTHKTTGTPFTVILTKVGEDYNLRSFGVREDIVAVKLVQGRIVLVNKDKKNEILPMEVGVTT